MDIIEGSFSIKVNDKGGIPYRDYTPTIFRKLFLESKTGANFELMSLIEGLTYLSYFIFCHVSGTPERYNEVLEKPIKNSFGVVIDYLYDGGVFDKPLRDQLIEYKNKRNEVVHNWLPLKNPLNPNLSEYSHDEALGKLFKCGIKTLTMLHRTVTPTKETWVEYVKKFSGLYKKKK